MIIVVRDALDGRSFPEAGDYVYNLMLPFADTDEEFVLDLQVCMIFRRCFLICA